MIPLTSCTKYSEQEKFAKTATKGSSRVACDQSFEKIMDQLIDVYEYRSKYEAAVLPTFIPENECIDSLLYNTKYESIVITRELNDNENAYLRTTKREARSERIAVDAVAIIANPKNTNDAISVSDLRDILEGKITDWSRINRGSFTGPIEVIFDDSNSSTVNCMRRDVLDGNEITATNVYAQKSNDRVFEYVAANPNAIGIIGVSWLSYDLERKAMTQKELEDSIERLAKEVENSGTNVEARNVTFSGSIKVLGVSNPTAANDFDTRAYKPYQNNIYGDEATGRRLYPLVRSIYMITTSYTNTPAAGFYTFVTHAIGQKVILKTGVLPGQIQEVGMAMEQN